MKTIDFVVIGCLFWTLIAIEGVYSEPLFEPPTIQLITGTRTIIPIIHTTPRIPTSCPNLFSYNSAYKKCYYISGSTMGFIAANDTCVNSGGSLVIAKTDDELIFLAQMIPGSGGTNAWIGVTYRTINGTPDYYWLDGTPFTSCKRDMYTPYSFNSVMALRRMDNCTANWYVSHLAYIICEATPFY